MSNQISVNSCRKNLPRQASEGRLKMSAQRESLPINENENEKMNKESGVHLSNLTTFILEDSADKRTS